MKRIPDFFVVGAAKSGTTSLYHYLIQHPSIYMPTVKEPNYLAYQGGDWNLKGPVSEQRIREVIYPDTIRDEKSYFALFDAAAAEQISGEASPRYLYYPAAAATLAELAPNAKLIVLLRDPVLRAHSHYRMNREFNLEPLKSFEAAVAAEPDRIRNGYGWDWHYLNVSRYGAQLQNLLDHFPREQVYVCTYERFVESSQLVCEEICRFLNVSDEITFDVSGRHKVSQSASGWLGASLNHPEMSSTVKLLRRVMPRELGRRIKRRLLSYLEKRDAEKQKLRPATYLKLNDELRSDIALLQKLTDADLSAWRNNELRYRDKASGNSTGATDDHASQRQNALQQ